MTARPTRREVLGGAGAVLLASAAAPGCAGPAAGAGGATPAADVQPRSAAVAPADPVIASTWDFGAQANGVALKALRAGVGHPLEAAEAGVRVVEADPTVTSVGYGGLPNADGVVELDAAVMRGDSLACGGVAGLQRVMHPVSVARAVMERTPHVLLVGQGALDFARSQGFPEQELLTDASRAAWAQWKRDRLRPDNEHDHDTIGLIVLDRGRFGVAVTTSGRAYKLAGRVGDSPIVGGGLYCDDRAGAAVSTGVGEEAIRACGSFAIVEAMRRGASAAEACRQITARVADNLRRAGRRDQVAFLAMDLSGAVAGCCTTGAFRYALSDAQGTAMLPSTVVW